MGFYREHVLPRIVDRACGVKELDARRTRVAEGLQGDIVEVGFGSGLNLPHLPRAVERVRAVDPATVGRRLAAGRLAACPVPVEFVGLEAEHLPLDDAVADGALCTFTLCTVHDPGLALRELHRVLRPGAALHFLEHGLSPDAPVARWQHRLTPLQRRLFGGCHLDRPVDRLLAANGFEVAHLRSEYMPGPKVLGYLYEGVARRV